MAVQILVVLEDVGENPDAVLSAIGMIKGVTAASIFTNEKETATIQNKIREEVLSSVRSTLAVVLGS